MFVQLVSKISKLCDPDPPTLQTDGQTDGRHALAASQDRVLQYSASRGKKLRRHCYIVLTAVIGFGE